mgnify:CR=1 FL=1
MMVRVGPEAYEDALAELLAGTDPVELTAKQTQVAVAQEALAKAGEDLAELVAGADPVELEAKQQQATVALAALTLASHADDSSDHVMLVLPADHVINDVGKFQSAVARGAELAGHGCVVTFGVVPTVPRPATAIFKEALTLTRFAAGRGRAGTT